tara:strand:+ start:501 stop:896 length:396 start_codon:yes stop_codon:yes gene_type:complete
MYHKITKKHPRKFVTSPLYFILTTDKCETGIIYTLYSDKSNLIKVGFAENQIALERTMLVKSEFVLLDKKKGKKKELELILNTLNELGIEFTNNMHFKYSTILMRHLTILGWPVGRTLYKQRIIRKELFCA